MFLHGSRIPRSRAATSESATSRNADGVGFRSGLMVVRMATQLAHLHAGSLDARPHTAQGS